jgi:hypothetical protein
MGGGKSTFFNIIYLSNKKHITKLPSKIYAYDLVKEFPKESFQNKLLMHDDLIPAIGGLSQKSREQVTGFFTELLGSFRYQQLGHIVEGKCNAQFGVARTWFKEFKKQYFAQTLFDRLTTIVPRQKGEEEKDKVLGHMIDRDNPKVPKVKLPIGRRRKILFDHNQINFQDLRTVCLGMDKSQIMSAPRALNYSINWMKGNALLNDRKEVCQYDLQLFLDIAPLHFGFESKMSRLNRLILKYPDLPDSQLIVKSGLSRRTFYRYKKALQGD